MYDCLLSHASQRVVFRLVYRRFPSISARAVPAFVISPLLVQAILRFQSHTDRPLHIHELLGSDVVRSRIARYSAAVVVGVSVRRAITEVERYRVTSYSSLNRAVAEHLEAVRRIMMLGNHIGGLGCVLLLNQSDELTKGQVGGSGLLIVDRLSHGKTTFH